jgi:hypothetical protein
MIEYLYAAGTIIFCVVVPVMLSTSSDWWN